MPADGRYRDEEETHPLTQRNDRRRRRIDGRRKSRDSISSVSSTSIVLQTIGDRARAANDHGPGPGRFKDGDHDEEEEEPDNADEEEFPLTELVDGEHDSSGHGPFKPAARRAKVLLWVFGAVVITAWLIALAMLVAFRFGHGSRSAAGAAASASANPSAGLGAGASGQKITLDQVLGGQWRAQTHRISWIEGAHGEDGLLLERDASSSQGYLVVEDVRSRSRNASGETHASKTLMWKEWFTVGSRTLSPSDLWPSRNLEKVLVVTDKESNWRHSYRGRYWIFDVASQQAEPLDPANSEGWVQLASWSPRSDAVVFTRDNNLFLRKLSSSDVIPITKDGGRELFYGVPDWVYEEEVFSGNSATWWAADGNFVAFLRTNETMVPEYPIQYFVSRPSGRRPAAGLENYPEVRQIKYPKAGAPNPVVDLQFYDVERDEVFSVAIDGDFPAHDRLITEVVWAGSSGQVLIRETNRESDVLQLVLVDVRARTGRVVRTVDVNALDHGWFEVSQDTRYIPADASRGRAQDGYIDTVIHDGYDHLAYFSPLDSATPRLLTSGAWEVVSAPSAVDLEANVVYFIGTREGPTQRHLYSVRLDGSALTAVTNTSAAGYYAASFSTGAQYALLSYEGPQIPWQRVISTPSNRAPSAYVDVVERNEALADRAARTALPTLRYSNVSVDGVTLQVVERRPADFDRGRRYPVLFYLYGGPGSQSVDMKWKVDFQSYVAATLGYLVVTVDGRGTGFIGRQARCVIRGNIGHYEARDQIATAQRWAAKPYVDPDRLAIWGWSYGGFLTLKTLEVDGGATFRYGMAVAPVTDWRFYDSIYTERYMHTPQHNAAGYANASIARVDRLAQNVRFLLMHGVADDNVHLQNSLSLLDKLDLAAVENYDVHLFPDSDHSIWFHNANRIVYDRLQNWLVNAFNGEWLRTRAAATRRLAGSKPALGRLAGGAVGER
ncbi:MAG: hypothetical protein M1826_003536 [Phylliscum demangeonii]|nr:MAG: hypothetical protein M1826_003536 [Phylliscum demangeonii]